MDKNDNISKIITWGGIAGIIGPIVALLFIFYSVTMYPHFSWYNNYLSDLGVGKTAPFFNYPLIFEGIMNFIFAIGFAYALQKGAWSKIGAILLIIGGASLALVGIFNENSADHIHYYVAMGYFVILPISLIVIGFVNYKRFKIYSIITIVLAIVALIVILSHGQHAIPELSEALLLSAWIIANSVLMITRKNNMFLQRKIGVEEWRH
ncbi:MAG: DUF998 domain-containing protein [Thermoplasmata archaeon]